MKEIYVVYSDGMMDLVSSIDLQMLIENNEIVKFQRSDGWVYPEIDPVRRHLRSGYRGPERRCA